MKSELAARLDEAGPFHGPSEQYSELFRWITLVEAAALLAGPWLLALLIVRKHPRIHFDQALPAPFWRLTLVDLLGAVATASYLVLDHRLRARVQAGGENALFLDGVRRQVASLIQSLVVLVGLVAVFLRM